MIFDPISIDMTEESKNEILSFFDSLTFNGVKEIKEIVSKVFNKTPTIDLVDYVLTNLKSQIKSFMNSVNINDKASDLIFDIAAKLIDREKKEDGSSVIDGKKVSYKNNILDIFFKDASTKNWLYESLEMVLQTYGIYIKGIQNGLLDEMIKQIYVNNSKISISSMQGIFEELKNSFAFFGNKKNYEIIFETKKDVTYNSEKNKVDFEFISKIVLKTNYTFSLDKFFNLLPNTVDLSFAQLNVDVKQYEWALKLLGLSTTHITVKTDLITRMFPKKISFIANDSFVLKYTPVDGKIFYKQQQKSGNYYHGFTSMVNASWYIEQKADNDGVITNLYKDFNSAADYNQGTENLIQYQYQAEQNYKMFDAYTQNLLVNKINTTIWLNGIDESVKINSPINETLYRKDKVFRWYDTDFNNEIFKFGSSSFGSKAYDNLVNKIKYRDVGLQKIKVSRVKDNKNNIETKELTRQEAYFEQNDQNQIANTLYYLGNGIDANKDITKSIEPLFNFKISKDIGIGVKFLGADINIKKININIELMAFEISVMFPYNVLDATNYYKDGSNNRLSNVKFSNHFSKTIFVPKLSIVL